MKTRFEFFSFHFTLFLLLVFGFLSLNAQVSGNWHQLDPVIDSVLGISSEKAYKHLEAKQSDTVIVAILDNGVDLDHEDLQGIFWVNPNEIEGNGIDDDQNGYIDDINGWNFLGNAEGENLKRDQIGLTRIYSKLEKKFQGLKEETVSKEDQAEFMEYQKVKLAFEEKIREKKELISNYEGMSSDLEIADQIIQDKLKKTDYSIEELQKIKRPKGKVLIAQEFLLKADKRSISREKLEKKINSLKLDLETRLNPEYRNREEIVGDNPDDLSDVNYGNNMLDVRGPYHGTSMAGVIAALQNDVGVNGVAKKVKLMILRLVPNGDERDKDIALALKYAINEGAQIINCSFAKPYSMHHDFIQLVAKEAEEAGVLIVQGSGNSGTDNDEIPYFPNGKNGSGVKSPIWLTVGASMPEDNENWVAYFSNYGKSSVDVFAPGYKVGSCALNNKYDKASGTSIAAPVVAASAAVLKSYYPFLSGQDLKKIIMESVYYPTSEKVKLPGPESESLINPKDISQTGGIVNLYNAIQLIESNYLDSEKKD